jgi:Ca-activated chloride channel family protein
MARTALRWVSAAALCALAGIAPSAQQPAPPQAMFRLAIRTVAIYATVTDPSGRLVPDLTKDDFEVTDNGQPQPLTLFANDIQPISLVVMLDTSGSMVANLGLIRSGTTQLITRFVAGDEARVGQFGDRIWLNAAFTADVNTLIRFMWEEIEPGGGTPLWNALTTAMNAFSVSHAPPNGRRVVLVFTDGYDSSGHEGLAYVMNRAQSEGFMIYGIGCRGSTGGPGGSGGFRGGRGGRGGGGGGGQTQGPDPGLRALADETGGGYVELKWTDDLGATFARVADELHHQYVLGIAPATDGLVHALGIRVKKPDMTARARKSYVATKDK